MKPWWLVIVPHRDIRKGKISDLAADLKSIMRGETSVEYADPETLFRRTHFTKGLENIAKDFFAVLSGKEQRGKVSQIQTPFGDVFVLRKGIAQKEKEKILSIGEAVTPTPPTPSPLAGPPKEFMRKVLRAQVPWDKLSDMVRGVFIPLRRDEAQVSLKVKIEAQSEQGIKIDPPRFENKRNFGSDWGKVLEEKDE